MEPLTAAAVTALAKKVFGVLKPHLATLLESAEETLRAPARGW